MTATPDSPLPGPARRDVVRGAAAGAAVATATVAPFATSPAQAATTTGFLHGVASGDPLPTAVVLWTRVTPTADAVPGSGRGPRVKVTWEVATDDDFTRIVRRGQVATGTERDHTVKVDASGLTPGTRYAYEVLVNERAVPRPAEVVVVFMDQPDGQVPEGAEQGRVGGVGCAASSPARRRSSTGRIRCRT